MASIPSNFDIQTGLEPAGHQGTASPDVEGAFRFICMPGHLSYNDPIVYPNQPGASHLHQYFGNLQVDAASTYESMRQTGESSCGNKVNRSGYWVPAMMNGKGQVVRPDYLTVYYKRRPMIDPIVSDPGHSRYQGQAVELPRGLRYIFGYDMVNHRAAASNSMWFNCDGPGAVPGHYKTITEALPNCPVGTRLGAIAFAPSCWDGINLDSADHRSHVAFAGYGSWGYLRCPDTHPYVIPQFTLGAWYTVDADLALWHFSSDRMPGMPAMTPGSTFHADWFGAWDDVVLKMWHDNCIDKMLNCAGGNLGNDLRIRDPSDFSWTASPRLVPVPER